ncbi:hypothetical protein A2U01_0055391, partial [Trifolium medium]|nr:hypothetical protein [Trifolium medium]
DSCWFVGSVGHPESSLGRYNTSTQGSESEQMKDHGDLEHCKNVSVLVEKIADELGHDEGEVEGYLPRIATDLHADSSTSQSFAAWG